MGLPDSCWGRMQNLLPYPTQFPSYGIRVCVCSALAITSIMSDGRKRRRLSDLCSQPAEPLNDAKSGVSALRASLAEARSTAILAERTRRDAEVSYARVVSEAERVRARALDDAQGMLVKSIAAMATVTELSEKLGIAAIEADAETEAEETEPVATEAGVGRRMVGIMSLPDCVIERIFTALGEFAPPFLVDHYCYPCPPSLRRFAFSCPRFAKLYRETYVKRLSIDVSLRSAEDQLVYLEGVDGALGRFASAEVVHVSGIDCVSRKLLDKEKDAYVSPLSTAERTDLQLAVESRKLIAATAARGLRDDSKIKQIYFAGEVDISDSVNIRFVSPSSFDIESFWKWRDEKEQWLNILPNVAVVEIDDLLSFWAAARLCGPAKANLKKLILSAEAILEQHIYCADVHGQSGDTVFHELSQLCNLETLVITGFLFLSDWESLEIPSLVEKLPRLKNIGVSCRFSDFDQVQFFDLVESKSCPLLKYLVPDLAKTNSCKFSVTFWSRNWLSSLANFYGEKADDSAHQDRLCSSEINKLGVQRFRNAVVGDFDSQWDITEGLCGGNLFEECLIHLPFVSDDDVVLHCRQSS